MKILNLLWLYSAYLLQFCVSVNQKKAHQKHIDCRRRADFSLASIEQNGNSAKCNFAFFSRQFQTMVNKDLSKNFGLFAGLALRNVGYIMND